MMSFKDWVLSQLVSRTLAELPLTSESFLSREMSNEEHENRATVVTLPASADTSYSSYNSNPESHNQFLPPHQLFIESSSQPTSIDIDKKNPIARIENLQIKFLRVLHRLGLPQDDIMVSKVLYRTHLATMIRARESDLKRFNLQIGKAREVAAEREAALGHSDLGFSFKVLLLGKTGVGKSSTINSIFDQSKATSNAFHPETTHVHEITGTVKGINISFIDTPGLLPSSLSNARRNRKVLNNVKRYIRKNPPDMVLYFERLDLINTGDYYSDFPLLKLVTEVFGTSIWFNTILVMTHSSSPLPEGPLGYPVTFESYTARCTSFIQHHIHLAVSDPKLQNPVILVENHPNCKTNDSGEQILPNGSVWMVQFFLTCICTKVLGDVNNAFDFEDSIQLGPPKVTRLPSLPHLLSSFLKHRAQLTHDETQGLVDEEDEYDDLPPIRILTKAQFKQLSPGENNDYLDELDFRETLYLKKQMKEASRSSQDGRAELTDPVLLPDMDIPPSFTSDWLTHRYRSLTTTSEQWVARPVLDPHGWDNDVSFDGINLETTRKVSKNVVATANGQMRKDKQDFSTQSECTAAYMDPGRPVSSVVGLDIQSAGQVPICSVHSSVQVKNLKHNITGCGVSLTSFGGNYFLGAKVEDSFTIKKRLRFTVNGGRMAAAGGGAEAHGGSFGATLRGKDYPVRNESASFSVTVLTLNKETVLSGNLQADFRVSRGTDVSVSANLSSQKMGQVSIKTSSCEHMQIALIALLSIAGGLLRNMVLKDHKTTETPEIESSL
ncbi:hypothetical protein DM860_016426 [Cuscuta australis]|uniref:AIG1-type G domain-containing protein n=1 Tax=Cuscuta australis TaxID=267555 RepID=A0A328DFV7_9ASTE|nr:hypothetical protein DM860_016426 [Cuscuta australis]